MTSTSVELIGRSREIILKLLKKVDAMGADINLTEQSTIYRRRAAALGRAADLEEDHEALLELVREAISWIQLAENEEALAFSPRAQ